MNKFSLKCLIPHFPLFGSAVTIFFFFSEFRPFEKINFRDFDFQDFGYFLNVLVLFNVRISKGVEKQKNSIYRAISLQPAFFFDLPSISNYPSSI